MSYWHGSSDNGILKGSRYHRAQYDKKIQKGKEREDAGSWKAFRWVWHEPHMIGRDSTLQEREGGGK